MMSQCYIAGKITGLTDEQVKNNFAAARTEVMNLGFYPISPLELPHNHARTWELYMEEDLAAMRKCQAVYAQRNWQDSKGATIEVNEAIERGIPVIYQP